MRIEESKMKDLPTGAKLEQERARRLLLLGKVAKALNCHPSAVRAIERNNRVIPPGWCEELRRLGMKIVEPVWPQDMPQYLATDLVREMQTHAGLQHSPHWLSKKLCVAESAVQLVLGSKGVVPQSWLLKLAELGADVPAPVRMALYQSTHSNDAQESEGLDWDFTLPERPATDAANSTASSTDRAKQMDTSAPRERQSIYFHWTEDGGLHFSVSAPLLAQIPEALKEFFTVLMQSGVLQSSRGPSTPAKGS